MAMTVFNPRGWSGLPHGIEPHDRRGRRPGDLNRETVQRWIMAAAFCLCFASLAPASMMPLAFAGLLFIAGLASICLAYMRGDHPLAPHLTAWDEAAFSLAVSLFLVLWLKAPSTI
jgi:hypothetical protein